MSKKILFLAPEFPPSKLTGAIRPAKFAKYLHRFGWEVTILTFDHRDEINIELLDDLKDIRIEKCGIPKKIIVNDLGVSYLFQGYRQAMQLAKEIRPDYVLVSMPTYLNSLLALKIKKNFGIEYVLDYRDLWVGDPYSSKGLKNKIFKVISKFIEPLVLRSAYLSYYVSERMLQDQLQLYPFLANKKKIVISTGYDPDDIEKIIPSDIKNGYISHIGNADPDMNLYDLVELIKDDKVQSIMIEKDLKFFFVGRKNNFLKNILDEDIIRFFDFKEYVPHNEALQIMADSSGLMILGSNSPQRLNRKVFEYTALNGNVFYLGNINSPTALIVKDFDGIVSDVSDKVEKMIVFLEGLSNKKVILSPKYRKNNLVEKLVESL